MSDPGICLRLRLWPSRGRERSNAGQHLVKLGVERCRHPLLLPWGRALD
jgi:hypothetical protein